MSGNGDGGSNSLCKSCARAAGGFGCPWVDNIPSGRTPVSGWRAHGERRKDLKNKVHVLVIVEACPLFEADS